MTDDQLSQYAATYPDVALSGLSPREHWELIGSRLGRTIPHLAPLAVHPPSENGKSAKSERVDRGSVGPESLHQALEGAHPRAATFIHLYYRDLWDEVAAHLHNIPLHFDLYVTLSEDHGPAEDLTSRIRERFPKAEVLVLPNRGLDCAPFVEIFRHALKLGRSYDYALKLHTKKSLGADPVVGEWWRRKTYDSLLGSPQIVLQILRRFASQPELGMVGPANTRMSVSQNDAAHGSDVNRRHFERLASAFDVNDRNLDFFGGTMFWFRWDSLAPYLRKETITIADYEPGYQVDGLLAHGMERMFASMVRDQGGTLHEQDYIHDVLALRQQKKTICFVHPGFGIGGGNRVLFDVGRALGEYYNVYSVSFMGGSFTHWMNVDHPVAHLPSPDHVAEFLRAINCDHVFATGWQTFDFVNSLPAHFKKFYFIQDYEPWFAGAEQAAATYSNNFTGNFVIAEWLQSKLQADHGLETTLIRLGVGQPTTNPTSRTKPKPTTLLCYHKLRGHRGRGADLIEEFLKLAVGTTNLEIRVVGHEDPKVPGANFLGELHGAKLEALYADSDVLVDLSRHRGIATMAMEMARYGTVPILSAHAYGLKEYGFLHERTALFGDSPTEAATHVERLQKDPSLFERLSRSVQSLSTTFDYAETIKSMLPVIESHQQAGLR
jgi:hypothetical protein